MRKTLTGLFYTSINNTKNPRLHQMGKFVTDSCRIDQKIYTHLVANLYLRKLVTRYNEI